jgi:hypothetical protein
MFQKSAKDEKQAKFFAVDAEMRARAAYNANSRFFESATHRSKVEAVVATLRTMLRINGTGFYEKIFETARNQKSKGVFTDVTVFKFMPNRYVKSVDVLDAMKELGFAAEYNVNSGNIRIVVK